MGTTWKYILSGILGAITVGATVGYLNAPSEREFDAFQDSLSNLGETAVVDSARPTTNLSVVVYEATLNDLLNTIGDLKGKGSLLFKSKLTSVEWKAKQPHVQINDSGAVLTATVNVRGIGLETESVVQGNATVEYNIEKKQIDIVLQEVPFTLRLKVFGKRIKLITLDIAGLVGPQIGVLGNLPLHADFNVKKHEGKKPVRFTIVRHVISYDTGRVNIDFEVDFIENGVINPSLKPDLYLENPPDTSQGTKKLPIDS